MLGLNSGLLGVRRVPTTGSASGLWVPNEQSLAKRAEIWPLVPELDPYFANVSLLLHMDGSNGSTTFTDSSSNAFAVTATNASISTARSKFGTGSYRRDSSSSYLTTPANTALQLGTGDFTVEFWIYLDDVSSQDRGFFEYGGGLGAGVDGATLWVVATGGDPTVISGGTVSAATWTHVAITRASGSMKAFINGTQAGSTYTSSENFTQNQATIGYLFSTSYGFTGNLDDLRITKGVARYTANFTPPTAAFPNF